MKDTMTAGLLWALEATYSSTGDVTLVHLLTDPKAAGAEWILG